MPEDPNRLATLADLHGLEQRFEARMTSQMPAQTETLIEKMRDMQTELLRGFADFAGASDIRSAKSRPTSAMSIPLPASGSRR